MIRNFWLIRIMFFCFFFYNIIEVNHFLYCFLILLHLISSFSLTRSLLASYAYVSIKSIDSILLSSFELKAILLIPSLKTLFLSLFFFSIWVFFHDHSRITGLQGKGEGISLTPHYQFHPLHRHLDISRVITAGSSPLHIASSRTRTGNLWFPSASR